MHLHEKKKDFTLLVFKNRARFRSTLYWNLTFGHIQPLNSAAETEGWKPSFLAENFSLWYTTVGIPNFKFTSWMYSAKKCIAAICNSTVCCQIVEPGLKVMFFVMIFGGTVEITFLAHIIDVDVSDLGFSWNRTSIEWLRSSLLCCKIWTALWFSNNLSYPISFNSFLQIFCDPPKVNPLQNPLQNPAWTYVRVRPLIYFSCQF